MPRWIILAILLLVVLGRSAVFVVSPGSYFDADQAVFGLMAKHLAELRAFSLFMYGHLSWKRCDGSVLLIPGVYQWP